MRHLDPICKVNNDVDFCKAKEVTKYSEILGETLSTGGDLCYGVRNYYTKQQKNNRHIDRYVNNKRKAISSNLETSERPTGIYQ